MNTGLLRQRLDLLKRGLRSHDCASPASSLSVEWAADVIATAAGELENLERALLSRTVIGQATGLLMTRHNLSDAAAFALLKQSSMEHNIKLSEIARRLVEEHNRSLTSP